MGWRSTADVGITADKSPVIVASRWIRVLIEGSLPGDRGAVDDEHADRRCGECFSVVEVPAPACES
jgi:hypothetical protein